MRDRFDRVVFAMYRLLPEGLTHRVVRTVMPSYTLGVIPFITGGDGRVLLVRQSYRPDRWGAPGGLCSRGEHPGETTVREAREEVGVAIEIVGEPAIAVDPVRHKVQFVTRCRLADGVGPEDATPSSSEIVEVGWFAPEEFPALLSDVEGAWSALRAAERSRPL